MNTNPNAIEAQADFDKASKEAETLAERIRACGHSGATRADIVVLVKAWQRAREAARASHERVLEQTRSRVRPAARSLAAAI